MNRADFLKNLGLGTAGLLLPKNLLVKKPIKIYDNYLKGLIHYDFKKVKHQIAVGNTLVLKRDLENIHDSFAVEVYFQNYKLGYLPAYENIVIANMLDAKVELDAKISYLKNTEEKDFWNAIGVEIFAELISPTEQLITELQNSRASDAEDIYRKGYNFS